VKKKKLLPKIGATEIKGKITSALMSIGSTADKGGDHSQIGRFLVTRKTRLHLINKRGGEALELGGRD
jgi:hypothetical protein